MCKIDFKKLILLLLIIFVGGFLRFFKLSEFPVQLNHDEVSQLYDTASIVQTGKDIYGNFLPLAFPSTGDYKVGHYIYISTISYLIFGDREITIRIPAAFFGTLTIVAVFLFVQSITKNWIIALISAASLAITPSEIFYSRKSFESVIGVCLVFFGLYNFMNSLNRAKSKLWGYGAAFFLASAMYVYTSHIIVVPLLILLCVLAFKKEKTFQHKRFFYPLILWLILIIPLVYITFTHANLRFRAASVFITQDVNLNRQLEFSQNHPKTYLDYIFNRYLSQFNPTYLFVNGLDLTNQGLMGMGPLLLWQLPFLVLGIIFIVRSKLSSGQKLFFFGLATIPMIPSAITFESHSPHRAMLEFAILSIISAFGLYWLMNLIRHLALIGILVALFVINFIYFIHMYTISYPYEKSQHLHYPFKQVALFAWSEHDNFDQIIIDPTYGQSAPVYGVATHYYLAYYGKYSPAQLQKDLKIKDDGMTFDKFYIRKINWAKDHSLSNALLIASPWSLPIDSIDKKQILKRFDFYDGQLAFYAVRLD